MSPTLVKYLLIVFAIIYFILPFDLLPDMFGLPGRLDDLALIIFLRWQYKRYVKRYQVQYEQTSSPHDDSSQADAQTKTKHTKGKAFDPYEILEVSKGATKEEIERRYKKLIAKYHPDKVNHLGEELQKVAHEKSIELQKAFEQLSK